MRTLTLLSSLLLAALASCGGASTPEALVEKGTTALNKSDYEGAAASLTQALAALKPGDPLYIKANMKLVETRINLDAESAKVEFLELAKANPDEVKEADFRTIGSKLTTAKKYVQAIDVIDAGIKTYGEDEKFMKMIEAIKVAANKAGDTAALKGLEGLGYL